MRNALVAFLLAVILVPVATWGWNQHLQNARADLAERAVRTAKHAFVLTPNQGIRFTEVYAGSEGVCLEFVSQDARPESIRWYAAVFADHRLVWNERRLDDNECGTSLADFTNHYLEAQ